MRFLLTILSISWVFCPQLGQASSKRNLNYLPLAVTLDGYLDQGGIQISLELPCGSKYEGLFIKEASSKILQVAAIASYDGILCAAIPERISLHITAIKASKYEVIEAIDVEALYPGSIKVTSPDDITLTANTSLTATADKRCGRPLGILLAPTPQHMQLGIVMLVNASNRSDCQKQSLTFHGPNLEEMKQVNKLNVASSSQSASYTIAVKPIKRIRRSASHMNLQYKRYCYEAPIGLVVMPAAARTAQTVQTTRLGVLVAQSDRTCLTHFPKELPASMHTKGLTISKHTSIKSLPYLSKNLKYQTIESAQTRVNSLKNQINGKRLRFNLTSEDMSSGGCQKVMGGVLKPLTPGKFGVGILTLASGKHCHKIKRQLAFHNIALNERVTSTDIIPLKIKGVGSN